MMNTRKEVESKRLEQLTQDIEKEVIHYFDDPEDLLDYLRFASQFYDYSFNNRLLIRKQAPYAQFVAGFHQWKDKGYSVKKGEKGIRILLPSLVKQYYDPDQRRWKDYKRAPVAVKRQVDAHQYEIRRKYVGVRSGMVFDISQTTAPLSDYPELLRHLVQEDVYQDMGDLSEPLLQYIAEQDDLSLCFKPLPVKLSGYYDKEDNSITINSLLDDTRTCQTLAHELAHYLLHRDRPLDEDGQDPNGLTAHDQEIQAELIATLLTAYYFPELPLDQHIRYLKQHYNKDTHPSFRKAIIQPVIETVEKLIRYSNRYLDERAEHRPNQAIMG